MNERRTSDFQEDDIARLLQAAGPREQIPGPMKDSWEQVFRSELEQVQSSGRRRRIIAAIAAGIAVLTLGSLLLQQEVPVGPVMRVVAVTGDGQAGSVPAQAGDLLPVGTILSTGSEGRLAMTWAGYDLRFDSDTRAVLDASGVKLAHGRLYVSDEDSSVQHYRLTVTTALATIRDIGTQFLVAAGPGGTEATVRRGEIVINTGSDEIQTGARSGQASRVLIDNSRQSITDLAAAYGEDWDWIYAVTPPHPIEGESVYDFLRWSTGESGLQLRFSDARAEHHARMTILHGSLPEHGPEQAVETILATTDLVAERDGNNLRISMKPLSQSE